MSERRYRHPQVNLRLPEDLKEKVSLLAERNKRSANAEMVAAIEAWVEAKQTPYPSSDDATVIITKKELKVLVDEIMDNALREIVRDFNIEAKNPNKKPT